MTDSWHCLLGDNEWCTADDWCFTCADAIHRRSVALGLCEPDCLQCKLPSLLLSPVVGQETRGSTIGKLGWKDSNSWERGLKLDDRGQPLLKADGSLITVKEFADRRGHYETALRDARTPIDSTTTR